MKKENLTKIFYIHKEVTNDAQRTLTVNQYYNKLKVLWDEYIVVIASLPDCSACTNAKVHAAQLDT